MEEVVREKLSKIGYDYSANRRNIRIKSLIFNNLIFLVKGIVLIINH